MNILRLCLLSGIAATALWGGDPDADLPSPTEDELQTVRDHSDAIWRVAAMVSDPEVQDLAKAQGLDVVNVTWEDTGRFENSTWGPNISDVTIEVHESVIRRPGTMDFIYREEANVVPMPVLRYPNFSDLTADLPIESITLLVGNERGQALRPVGLAEVLADLRSFLRDGEDWLGDAQSLLAERDSHVLVSAQATFLPIPAQGTATFNPVIYNYQSLPFDPGVLVILATANGTSITVIDPARDPDARGAQRLFHHADGRRAPLLGRRLSERLAADAEAAAAAAAAPEEVSPGHHAGPAAGLNMLMIIQVPLRQWSVEPMEALAQFPGPEVSGGFDLFGGDSGSAGQPDIEAAALEVGAFEGPFMEIGGLEIERDARYPIRVTVQFYQATSNGIIDAAALEPLVEQIRRVYEDADFVGSLVTDARAERPTRSHGPLTGPAPEWYASFWQPWEAEQGRTRSETERRLRKVLGEDWQPPASQAAFALMARGLFAEDERIAALRRRAWEYTGGFERVEEYADWLYFWEHSAGRIPVIDEDTEVDDTDGGF